MKQTKPQFGSKLADLTKQIEENKLKIAAIKEGPCTAESDTLTDALSAWNDKISKALATRPDHFHWKLVARQLLEIFQAPSDFTFIRDQFENAIENDGVYFDQDDFAAITIEFLEEQLAWLKSCIIRFNQLLTYQARSLAESIVQEPRKLEDCRGYVFGLRDRLAEISARFVNVPSKSKENLLKSLLSVHSLQLTLAGASKALQQFNHLSDAPSVENLMAIRCCMSLSEINEAMFIDTEKKVESYE